jgi:hypothetical protein
MRQCVCAAEDKGAAAGLESSEALGLAGAGPGGGECSPQVVRLGQLAGWQAGWQAGWHSLLFPLEPSLALLADVRLLQGASRGSRSNWDPGGGRRRRLDCKERSGCRSTAAVYHTLTHPSICGNKQTTHIPRYSPEPEIDDSFLRKNDETGGATTF